MQRAFPLWTFLVLGSAFSPARTDEPAATVLPPGRPIEEVIDHYISAGLKAAGVEPVAQADDAALLRRLTLDLAGRIPTLTETAAYLSSTDPEKKIKLVDRLLAGPAFARRQSREFLAFLLPREGGRKDSREGPFREYLRLCFAENRPWDQVFREILLPDDIDPKKRGASEFLKSRVKDSNRLTIDVSTVFFGVNISCAQCHDHPHVTDWKQDHFYGMKSFFARTFEAGGFLGEHEAGVVKYIPNKGKEKVAPVMFLTGKTIVAQNLREPTGDEKRKMQELLAVAKKSKKAPPPPSFSMRARLVETALEPGQRDFFARSIVNRLWNEFFGRGLVMPLDQMHTANPPSHPELHQWLARDLVEHGYDLRRLVRGLVLSGAYSRSSRWDTSKDQPPDKLFAVAKSRPLTPMQLAMSLRLASSDPQSFPGEPGELEKRLETLERNAERLADLFPQPGDNFQVGVSEAMLFANNASLLKELLEGTGTLPARLLTLPSLEARADLAVRAVLGRTAQPDELRALSDYLRQRQDRPEAACRQAVWALLTSAEFRFNH
jgi:hypothetical protein